MSITSQTVESLAHTIVNLSFLDRVEEIEKVAVGSFRHGMKFFRSGLKQSFINELKLSITKHGFQIGSHRSCDELRDESDDQLGPLKMDARKLSLGAAMDPHYAAILSESADRQQMERERLADVLEQTLPPDLQAEVDQARDECLQYKPLKGESLLQCAETALKIAKVAKRLVEFEFDGVKSTLLPGMTLDEVIWDYIRDRDRVRLADDPLRGVDISTWQLQPGDVLTVRVTDAPVSFGDKVRRNVQAKFPNNKVLLLSPDVVLSCLSSTEIEAVREKMLREKSIEQFLVDDLRARSDASFEEWKDKEVADGRMVTGTGCEPPKTAEAEPTYIPESVPGIKAGAWIARDGSGKWFWYTGDRPNWQKSFGEWYCSNGEGHKLGYEISIPLNEAFVGVPFEQSIFQTTKDGRGQFVPPKSVPGFSSGAWFAMDYDGKWATFTGKPDYLGDRWNNSDGTTWHYVTDGSRAHALLSSLAVAPEKSCFQTIHNG